MRNKGKSSRVCLTSDFMAGDEILFQFEGCVPGTVESVTFDRGRVRYRVRVSLVCEVPERLVVGHEGKESDGAGRA